MSVQHQNDGGLARFAARVDRRGMAFGELLNVAGGKG
jgi:hypothetical protein